MLSVYLERNHPDFETKEILPFTHEWKWRILYRQMGSGQTLALQPWHPLFDLQHHDREKTNTTRCLCLDGFTHLRYPNYSSTWRRTAGWCCQTWKRGSGALMLSEDAASALPDRKAPKTAHTMRAHLLSHSFRVPILFLHSFLRYSLFTCECIYVHMGVPCLCMYTETRRGHRSLRAIVTVIYKTTG